MADRSDFDGFVAARSDRLLHTAFYLTGDHALAEDLLQTALVKAWFAWGRVNADPEAYVRRILATTSTSWWRRKWRREAPHGPEDLAGAALRSADVGARAAGRPDHAAGADDRHDLWTALRQLPARQRAVVVLRFLDDLSEAQVANVLGCSVGTVKSQSSKALAKLRIDPGLAGYEAMPLRAVAIDESTLEPIAEETQ